MHKFEVPHNYGPPEAQFWADGILVEIAHFVPKEVDADDCRPHHLLLSWLSPQPVMGQVSFGSSGASPRYRDFGNLAFIPAAVPTQSRYYSGAGPRRAIVVRYASEVIDRLGEDEPCRYDPGAMASHNLRDPDIQYGMRQLAREAMAPGFASATLVESISTGLLVRLARHFGQGRRDSKAGRGGLAPWQIRRITERIADENVIDALPTITELAALAGISSGHLQRAFKQSAGCTLGEHIRDVRLERARALLSGSDLMLKEIALRLGFSSQYGFTVAFQRGTGETPSAFRQRVRGHRCN